MFLSVEGANPQVELERRRQVQGLINNSWRNTKYINAVRLAWVSGLPKGLGERRFFSRNVRLAQLGEQWSAEREVLGSDPSRTNHPMPGSLKKTGERRSQPRIFSLFNTQQKSRDWFVDGCMLLLCAKKDWVLLYFTCSQICAVAREIWDYVREFPKCKNWLDCVLDYFPPLQFQGDKILWICVAQGRRQK